MTDFQVYGATCFKADMISFAFPLPLLFNQSCAFVKEGGMSSFNRLGTRGCLKKNSRSQTIDLEQ